MKLFRADLDQGFSAKLFDISADSIAQDNLRIKGGSFSCSLSSNITAHGYYLTGTVKTTAWVTCDRCLKNYFTNHKTSLEFMLTDNLELLNEANVDVIWFPRSKEFVDLGDILRDIFLLEEPLKQLCDEECKGLCDKCGTNLNTHVCVCEENIQVRRWKKAKINI